MSANYEHVRNRGSRLMQAVRGQGALEDKLVLLGVIGGGLFCVLVATLFYVQHSLGDVQERLGEQALPALQEIARLESAIAGAFSRQAQISTTSASAQLDSLRDRSRVEQPLRESSTAIGRRLSELSPGLGERARAMNDHVEGFLAADAELLKAVARRHELQASFEKELGTIDGDLRALVEDSQAVSGILRLEYMLLLRGIAASLGHGAPRADLVRSAVLGDVRGALDDTSELANAVLALGWLNGKIGLAVSSDAINSLVANELPQNQTRIARLIGSLEDRVSSRADAAARVKLLAKRFADVAPRIMDDKRKDSLVSLRRQVLAEAQSAAKIRAETIAAAAALAGDTTLAQTEVASFVSDSVRAQQRTSTSTRVFSLLVTLLGLASCAVGARRIKQGVEELQANNRHLTELKDNLQDLNTHLESKVAERTAALVVRDQAMQRVLDSMTEGLVTVALDGTLLPEHSRAFTEWFGDPGAARIWDVLFPDDPTRAGLYRCGFEQIVDGIFPFEVATDQLPKQIHREERILALELRAVERDQKLDAILFVIRDVTEQIAAHTAERAAREEQKIIAQLLRDRRGFQRSIDEIKSLINITRVPNDDVVLKRALHTIKGNAAVLGLSSLAEHAHTIEDALERDGELPNAALDSLENRFQDSLRRVHEFIEHAHGRIDVRNSDYSQLVRQLERGEEHDAILAQVERWQLEPIANVLQSLAGHARRVAEQMGKRVEVAVEGNGIRVGNEHLRAFCSSLVHAVRNAVDHGLEMPAARLAAGKPEVGRLTLAAALQDDKLIVSIRDDGAGIDLSRVRELARARGLPITTSADVIDAVFESGLSTRSDVSEISGRGVGMGAIRTACHELGGEVRITTEPRRGTELRCELPAAALHADAVRLNVAS